MKTFKIQITEEELIALIKSHTTDLGVQAIKGKPSKQTAERIVELTRRLNKDTPEIEGDPKPKEKPSTDDNGWGLPDG